MTRDSLLRSIAETGYNVGFGAKKHFATYDLHRVAPKVISFITLAIGVIQLTSLYKAAITGNWQDFFSVVLIVAGLIAFTIDLTGRNIDRYNETGKDLLRIFNELRALYNDVKLGRDDALLPQFAARLREIEDDFREKSISEQAIGTHIYTNFAFHTGGMQIDWIDEQLHFKLKDRFPFFHWEALLLYALAMTMTWYAIRHLHC